MRVGKYHSSGKFTIGGHVWVLLFNPDRNYEVSKEYISMYLLLVSPRQEVRAFYEFELLDHNDKKKCVFVTINNLNYVESFRCFNYGGSRRVMNRSDLDTSTYLKDDCLSIVCNIKVVQNHVEMISSMALKRPRDSMSNSNNDHEMSTSRWIHETVKGSHEFKIQGYSLAKGMGVGKYMTSGKFTVGGHEWVVIFNPNGNTEDSKEYVSMFLKLISPGQEEVRVLYEFKLLDQSSGKYGVYVSPEPPITFNTQTSIWYYMKRSDFETSSYLKDDCLSIHCTVGVVQTHVETLQTRVEEGQQYVIPVPPSDLSQNLKGLLESGIHSDITFQVGDKSFKAHKSILAARCSPQFFDLVGNLDTETVAIEKFDPFAFKAMLLFLYSDELPEPRELFDLDPHCTSTTIIQHLLVAANRYVLARLKLMCEAKLCEQIDANTVAKILALAKDHQCLQLKTACLNFAVKPENLGEVMKSAGFALLEKNNPSLLIALLKASAVADKK
ncbi:hypothetical protein MKX03_008537 [Papaver bracteatum]|nr:hypothetical protein MKX03_008537 [Papaver bracteatum]